MNVNSADFWQNRYDTGRFNWDLGGVSPPLKAYFDGLTDKSMRILIAGAGNAHEAAYLHEQGFGQVYVVDFVASLLDNFAKAHPDFDDKHLICHDFFDLHHLGVGQFDLIIEQTFLCAIDPARRHEYALQMQRLLADGGRLVGVLFDCEFGQSPPFSGSLAEYQSLFSPYFDITVMARCHNSVKPRAGRELFIILTKK